MAESKWKVSRFVKGATVAAGAIAVLGATAGKAQAATYPVFEFNPTVFSSGAECLNPFAVSCVTQQGDRISGNYYENLTIDLSTGSFSATGYAKFVFINDETDANIAAKTSGLTNTYNLYAPFSAQGTVFVDATGFHFTATSATGDLYVDDNLDTVFDTSTANGSYDIPDPTLQADDKLLISGIFFNGFGNADQNGGFYTLRYNPIHLTDNGTSCSGDGVSGGVGPGCTFFTFPNPFYLGALLTGELINPVDGNNTVNGTADLIFTPVPEPATLTLLGLGLVGVARKRLKK